MFLITSSPTRRRIVKLVVSAATTAALVASPSFAATTKPKRTVAKKATKKRMPTTLPVARPATTTTLRLAPSTTVLVSAKDRVLQGYEAYFTAFVAAAREPQRAKELLPQGMTGDALTRLLEIHRLDAADGVFWDGTRADIISAPRIETIGDTTATIRDCRSVGGVLRKKSTNEVVPGTADPDIDDFKVTLVLVERKWKVTSTERFNDAEGRSKCVPGSPSP